MNIDSVTIKITFEVQYFNLCFEFFFANMLLEVACVIIKYDLSEIRFCATVSRGRIWK